MAGKPRTSRGVATRARDIALEALARVERDAAFASAALSSALSAAPRLDARDRALATELVYGVLRWRGALDAALSSCAPRGIASLDPHVLAALRVAVYQVSHLDRIPAAAAVSAAVDQIRALRGERLASFVNGLLRGVSRSEAAMALARDPVHAHPAWLVDALRTLIPPDEIAFALAAALTPSPVCLRANLRRTSRDALSERLRREIEGVETHPGELVATCLRAQGLGDPQATAAFVAGDYTVQDEGAQQVVAMAAHAVLSRGLSAPRVLDACAGRGGKTGGLAESLGPTARIDAVDRHPDKIARLQADLRRLGIGPDEVRALAVDLEVGVGPLEPGYDLVLLDAPCSGTGVIRRRPEVRWRRTPADVARLAGVQKHLLARVAPLVAAGGALVYSVCSILPQEGAQVAAGAPAGLVLEHESSLWPHRDDTDGFYIARFRKSA